MRRSYRPVVVIAVLAALAVLAVPASASPGSFRVGPGVEAAAAPETGPSLDRDQRDTRIIGGSPVSIADFPWQVAIDFSPAVRPGEDAYQRQFCGGTLVAPNVVISAAHCFFDESTGTFTPASDYTAITGRTVLSSGAGQEIPFADYFFFTDSATGAPLYNPSTSDFDVVWIILQAPSGTGAPIQIAGADERAAWNPGQVARISGWGNTSTTVNSFPDDLRAAQVQIIEDQTCVNNYAVGGVPINPQVMVCAGLPQGGVDTCQGDSGGPLVAAAPGGTATRLVGDTSFGIGCADPQFPGVYGRLADDPLRSLLRSGILDTAGVDVVGDSFDPKTKLRKKPKKKTRKRKAKFKFQASEPVTFKCKLDRKKAKSCRSPAEFRVGRGKHKMRITATDTAGKSSTVKYGWKVIK
jgi:hypothetical protein